MINRVPYRTFFDTENRSFKDATWIDVDSKKYADGLYKAGQYFIEQAILETK